MECLDTPIPLHELQLTDSRAQPLKMIENLSLEATL